MSEKVMENSQVGVIGKVVSGFTFSHSVFGEGGSSWSLHFPEEYQKGTDQ